MALKHKDLCLKDGLVAQREVNSHLVAVEVSVERGTCQRMVLDGLTLNQFGLEGLNTQTVQCRSTVEQHRVSLHHVLQDVPDDGFAAVNDFLRTLHGLDDTALDEFADDERLVEFGSHESRQTALTHLQFRTDDDNRTCRVVNTLT